MHMQLLFRHSLLLKCSDLQREHSAIVMSDNRRRTSIDFRQWPYCQWQHATSQLQKNVTRLIRNVRDLIEPFSLVEITVNSSKHS